MSGRNGSQEGNVLINTEEVLVGGQAVIEGVMMRAPRTYAVAVRRADGRIEVKKDAVKKLSNRWNFLKLPVIRGFAVLIQSLVLGFRALNFSYEAALKDLKDGGDPKPYADGQKSGGSTLSMIPMFIFALGLSVGLFILLPLYLTTFVRAHLTVVENWVVFNLVDGLFRVTFFLAYLGAILLMKDVKRLFQYHGAEHKVVYTWEAKQELTVENARRQSRFHPRCGTSFLLFVMVVSILVFSIFKFKQFHLLFLSRVLLIPLIAGLSYELIRLSAKKIDPKNIGASGSFFRLVTKPGLWLQRLTTQEPSDDQLDVAICALKEALALEEEEVKSEVAVAV